MAFAISFSSEQIMTGQDRYERRPLDGFAARGFSAAYDEDRARAEKELAGTMAGPKDFCATEDHTHDAPQDEADRSRHAHVAMGGRTAHDTV